MILTQPRSNVKKSGKMMPLIQAMLTKYPEVEIAMEHRDKKYNEETADIFEKEKQGEVVVLCPSASLHVGKAEKNPDELQRVC